MFVRMKVRLLRRDSIIFSIFFQYFNFNIQFVFQIVVRSLKHNGINLTRVSGNPPRAQSRIVYGGC